MIYKLTLKVIFLGALVLLHGCSDRLDSVDTTQVNLSIEPLKLASGDLLHEWEYRNTSTNYLAVISDLLIKQANAALVETTYPSLSSITLSIHGTGFSNAEINKFFNQSHFSLKNDALLITDTDIQVVVPKSAQVTFNIKAYVLLDQNDVQSGEIQFYSGSVTVSSEQLSHEIIESVVEMRTDIDGAIPKLSSVSNCTDTDADGYCDRFEDLFRVVNPLTGDVVSDVDLDGLPNSQDLDSDNDGFSDASEIEDEYTHTIPNFVLFNEFFDFNNLDDEDLAITILQGGVSTISLPAETFYNPDNPEATVAIVLNKAPQNGVLLIDGQPITVGAVFESSAILEGRLTYEHNGSELTYDQFTIYLGGAPVQNQMRQGAVTIIDEGGGYYTFIIEVTPTNDPPELTDDVVVTTADVTTGNLLSNDSDPEGDSLLITEINSSSSNVGAIVAGSYGELVVAANGDYMYAVTDSAAIQALAEGESVTEVFQYTVQDSSGNNAKANLSIILNGTNQPPQFSSQPVTSINEDENYSYSIVTIDVDSSDHLTITLPSVSNWLNITDNGDGTATLAGVAGDSDIGVHSITIAVSDGITTIEQSFQLNVSNINDPPQGSVTIDNSSPSQGDTLTASNTLADADGLSGTISYEWFRSTDSGSTWSSITLGSTLTLTQAEVGQQLKVVAAYTDDLGASESVESNWTAAVANVNDSPTGTVDIDNSSPSQGDTLTASNTLADADGLSGTISYEWFGSSDGGASWSSIATGSTLTLTQAEVGQHIKVAASYIDDLGSAESLDSNATDAVLALSYTIGGSVTGLSGSVTLQNNSGDDLTVTTDGSFTFSQVILDGDAYSVSIFTQPTGQQCSVTNGSGTATADVTDVQVNCLNELTIGGSVTGLSGSVTLQNNSGDDLTVTADGSFSFSQVVLDGDSYSVTVLTQPTNQTCTVTSGSGTATADVTNVAVSCQSASSWGTETLIQSSATGDASAPRIVYGSDGSAWAVWSEFDLGTENIIARKYSAGTWGSPVTISSTTNFTGDPAPAVGLDGTGKPMVVWSESDGLVINIMFSRFDGTNWSTPAAISDTNTDAYNPEIAVKSDGSAVVAWFQDDGTFSFTNDVWANRFDGTNWGGAGKISDGTSNATYPSVAIDSAGNAMVVWEQLDGTGTRSDIYSNYYSGSWGGSGLVETEDAGDALDAHVSIDGNGVAFAVWAQSDGAVYNIKSNRYIAASGWEGVASIESDDTGDAIRARIVSDSSGNAIAIWTQLGADGYVNVMTNRYAASGGWGTVSSVENGTGNAADAHIALDGSGGAYAAWFQDDGLGTIHTWANHSVDGTNWGTAELLESDNNSPNNLGLDIAVDESTGNATAVWSQLETTDFLNQVWTNSFE